MNYSPSTIEIYTVHTCILNQVPQRWVFKQIHIVSWLWLFSLWCARGRRPQQSSIFMRVGWRRETCSLATGFTSALPPCVQPARPPACYATQDPQVSSFPAAVSWGDVLLTAVESHCLTLWGRDCHTPCASTDAKTLLLTHTWPHACDYNTHYSYGTWVHIL